MFLKFTWSPHPGGIREWSLFMAGVCEGGGIWEGRAKKVLLSFM